MGTKKGVKRAIRHKAMDPGTKKTAKMPKNDEEDNPGGSSLKESKKQKPTKDKTDMGEKDAAKGTRQMHIQMGAEAIAKPRYNMYEAAYIRATKKHKANMAKTTNHTEMDP